jgi:Acetyltransferase (GNAT) domain
MSFCVRPYRVTDEVLWNSIVASSRNGNFLHDRRYMDYHADRFHDVSLIVEDAGKAVAVFPASRHENEVVSHGGLTYGGLLSSADLHASGVLEAMRLLLAFYREAGADRLIYKAIPSIFHRYPCEEDLYALSRYDARLCRRDLSSAVDLSRPLPFSKGRKWAVNKSRKTMASVAESSSFEAFHQLLEETLRKFDAVPTHSLEELQLLHSRFPQHIRLFECRRSNELLAAAVIYDFGDTVHTQYMASSPQGREDGALDRLIVELMQDVYGNRRYFSFGISTESSGKILNGGLVAQKEGFGARGVVHDFYEVSLQNNINF